MRRDPSYESPDGPKSVGAYYTPSAAARALSTWALRRAGERALDPAAGDGVFLLEAARRGRELGSDTPAVTGVEMRPEALEQAALRLRGAGLGAAGLEHADFLALAPERFPAFDAVLGNPPFVRYQRLDAGQRQRARSAAAAAGVTLDPLASLWAPFVVHAGGFLKRGGRLALILPSEVGHARYARPVLEHLRSCYADVTFVLFASALFPSLDQGTVLLLADGRGLPFRGMHVARLDSIEALDRGLAALPRSRLDAAALERGDVRLHHAWLGSEAATALAAATTSPSAARLATWCDVSIGYVTGANGFFHLSPERAHELGLDRRHLRPAVFRSRALRGLELDRATWRAGTADGLTGYLLTPADSDDPAVAAYLERGVAAGVPLRAKARRRRPWYRVTRLTAPDLVLTAMSVDAPRLARNSVGAAVANTLHAVHLRPHAPPWLGPVLALASLTSLAELSAELEGHALGGGLLKLEPSEALRLLLPLPTELPEAPPGALRDALAEADRALRAGDRHGARAAADAALLAEAPGLGAEAGAVWAAAAARLRAVRRGARRRTRPAEVR